MRLLKTRLLLLTGAVTSVGVTGSLAAFDDTKTLTGNTFATGTVTLSATGGLSSGSVIFSASNASPGTTTYGYVDVQNTGSLNLSYTMSTAATNTDTKNLKGSLVTDVAVTTTATTCGAGVFGGSPTLVVNNVTGLDSVAVSSRALASGAAAERLCFRIALPAGAGNSLQGASTTATFTFNGS